MHTFPDHINNKDGIKITKRQTVFARCSCGNGFDLTLINEIQTNQKCLHNLSEAMRINSAFTGDVQTRHYNTSVMLFSLFDVMFHR